MSIRGLMFSLLVFLACSGGTLFSQEGTSDQMLRVGLRESPPFVIVDGDLYSGLSVDLWQSIAPMLNMQYEYVYYNDLGELLLAIEKGDVDLCINPMTVTSERLRRFSFSQPYFISNMAIAGKFVEDRAVTSFIMSFFSREFLQVAFLLFLTIFVFGFLLWLVERRSNPDQFGKGLGGLGDGIWWSAVTMTTVGYGDKAPKSGIGRIISIVWMFTAVIIISSFTASISASLTFSKLQLNINNIEDLRGVQVGTIKNSSSAELLQEKRILYVGFDNLDEAVDALYNDELKAVVYDEPLLTYIINDKGYADRIKLITSTAMSLYFGFSSSDARLLENLNPYLIGMIESEAWRRTLEKYNIERE
jgi:polar amino acid transport system substrate-binding protein